MPTPVYLDYAATSPLLPEVRARMQEILALSTSGELGNPTALHAAGQRSSKLLEKARVEVAALIHAEPEEIFFTSGATEANNTVLAAFRDQAIITSAIEHPSVLEPAKHYGKRHLIPVDQQGIVSLSALESTLKSTTGPALVSIMLVNNELGTLEPLEEISALAARFHVPLHTDASQAAGKLPLDVRALPVDYLTLSSHKLGGPVGIGALYVRKGAKITPLLLGGHQQEGFRAGTESVLLASGFATAARLARERLPLYASRVRPLRDSLARRILAEVPYSSLNTPLDTSAPHILNVSFAAAEGESIQLYLDAAGIVVSTGSACAARDLRPSHVLMATHHSAERAHSSLRFSLSPETTEEDIDRVLSVLPGIIQKLQGISTVPLPDTETPLPAAESQTPSPAAGGPDA